jgi:hypothetical protein
VTSDEYLKVMRQKAMEKEIVEEIRQNKKKGKGKKMS